MQQIYCENKNYEIWTPNGWESFDGIFQNKNAQKPSKKITFDDSSFIIATNDHTFFSNKSEIKVKDMYIGMSLDSIDGQKSIISLDELILEDTFEIFNAENHVIVANNLHSHQCDEFAFVRPTIAREFWTSISPTLSTGGKAIITSTPNGDEDTFSHIWREANKIWDEYGNARELGSNGFKSYKADWKAHPERDQKWGDEEKSRLGEEKFRREHCLEFIRDDELLISSLKLAVLEGTDPIYKQGQIRWFKKPDRQYTYLVSLDPSLGTGGDPSAIQVFEMPTMIQVGEWQHNRTMIPGQIEVMRQITQHIKEAGGEDTVIYWSVENNTIGEAALIVINEMGEENIPGTFLSEPAKMGSGRRYRRGFTTTNKSKLAACSKLKNLIETDRMTVNSKLLISELKNFVAIGGSYKAKLGEKDDLVMSTLLVVRMGQFISGFDDKIYDKFAEKFEADYQVPLPIFVLR
jgi:hypothetical protein